MVIGYFTSTRLITSILILSLWVVTESYHKIQLGLFLTGLNLQNHIPEKYNKGTL